MADLVLGFILAGGLLVLTTFAIYHSRETRKQMIEQMQDETQEEEPQPQTSKAEDEKKPATKKRSSKKQTS
jgi:hypothetical protein